MKLPKIRGRLADIRTELDRLEVLQTDLDTAESALMEEGGRLQVMADEAESEERRESARAAEEAEIQAELDAELQREAARLAYLEVQAALE